MATRTSATASLLRRSLLRRLSGRHTPLPAQISPSIPQLQFPTPSTTSPYFPPRLAGDSFPFSSRSFSSGSDPSNIVLLQTGDQVTAALQKAQDEKLPAIFYFTAVWCGPCRTIAPLIAEMSHKFPHVTTYKIDIDQDGLGTILSSLKIYSVPTFHFFHDGKKTTEIVGADAEGLKSTMVNLYKEA